MNTGARWLMYLGAIVFFLGFILVAKNHENPAITGVLVSLVSIALVVVFVLALVSAGVRSGMGQARKDDENESSVPSARGFPVQQPQGPGRYEVIGVDRESRFDTSLAVRADSAANAKVKAELQGIVVTEVKYVGP